MLLAALYLHFDWQHNVGLMLAKAQRFRLHSTPEFFLKSLAGCVQLVPLLWLRAVEKRREPSVALWPGWLAYGVLLLILARAPFWLRHFLPVLPAVFVLAAVGLDRMPGRERRLAYALLLVTAAANIGATAWQIHELGPVAAGDRGVHRHALAAGAPGAVRLGQRESGRATQAAQLRPRNSGKQLGLRGGELLIGDDARHAELKSSEMLWEETKSWAEQRVLFGKPLSKMQNTQFKMVEALTQIRAANELLRACVGKIVDGEDATMEVSMAKLFCGRVARHVADECVQLQGGFGYMTESMAGRAWVSSRIASIGGGSDETMMHYLAKRLGF